MFERIVEQCGRTRILVLGPIEATLAAALREELEHVALRESGAVVLDFTEVTLIDGSAIGAIAYLYKRLHVQGRRLSVEGAAGQPLALLTRLGIAGLLGIGEGREMRPLFARGAWAGARLMGLGRSIAG